MDLPLTGRPANIYLSAESRPDDLIQVTVDRACGQPLSIRAFHATPMMLIYRFHSRLLAGQSGRYVIAGASVALAVSLVSGLVLWWPKNGRRSPALSLKRHGSGFKQLYSWHRLVGLAATPVLASIALSGLYLSLQPDLRPALDALAPPAPSATLLHSVRDGPPVSADQAIATASALLPEGRFTYLELPDKPDGAYAVWLRQPHEASQVFARSIVWVSFREGRVLGVRDARHVGALLAAQDWMFPMHDGQALGTIGRAVWCGAGLAPAALLVTGILVWSHKRRARRRANPLRQMPSADAVR